MFVQSYSFIHERMAGSVEEVATSKYLLEEVATSKCLLARYGYNEYCTCSLDFMVSVGIVRMMVSVYS